MKHEHYSGTTRNTDPFTHGTGHMYDGMRYEDAIRNMVAPKNLKGRMVHGTENNAILEKVAQYIKEYGLVKVKNICTISGLEPAHLKYLLTYRYPVYEPDNGGLIGMLDENGDPYPIKPEPEILPKYNVSKKLNNRIVAEKNGEKLYFTSQRQASRYFEVDTSTIKRVLDGGKTRAKNMQGVKIRWIWEDE